MFEQWHRERLTDLLQLSGGGSAGTLGCKLDLARRPLGQREDTLLGAGGDGTVELEEVTAAHVKIVFILCELRTMDIRWRAQEC